jgi:hypothetical protein
MSVVTNQADELMAIREEIAIVRRRADSEALYEIGRVHEQHRDLSEHKLQRLITNACRPHRVRESEALHELTRRLSSQAREQLFNETLDTHFLPPQLAQKIPPSLVSVL